MHRSALGLGLFALVSLSTVLPTYAQTYSATYSPDSLPDKTETGQTGTNKCGTASSQNSTCQNSYSSSADHFYAPHLFTHIFRIAVNSVDDFCLFAPPEPGPGSVIGNTEVGDHSSIDSAVFSDPSPSLPLQQIEVSWCLKVGGALVNHSLPP